MFSKNVLIVALVSIMLLTGCSQKASEPWKAIHLLGYTNDAALDELAGVLPQLADKGLNTLILEVDYHFEFESFPELRQSDNVISKTGAQNFANLCRKNNIRLITQFQCFGHQSWAGETYALLSVYPELDLTPGAFANNEGIYCREWDPYNPRVNEIVFALMGEIIDAFQVDAMHVGMDEVFLIGSEFALSTKDKDPAEVFAKVVNDMHGFLVKEKGVEMLMWGDRFIDANVFDYGEWEASTNGTAPAIDEVPKDIIICDWHYEPREAYESVPMFLDKGFRVLPSSWRNVEASQAFINYSLQQNHENMLGHLFTTWRRMPAEQLIQFESMVKGLDILNSTQN
jgi:hypothetical protein